MRRLSSGLVAVAALATWAAPSGADARSFYQQPKHLARYSVGTVIKSQPAKKVDPAVQQAGKLLRFMYRSEDATGAPRAETGVIIVPHGRAPSGGWPVVAWDHGTTGVGPACAPSRVPLLGDEASQYAPYLASIVARGYVVVAPDYEGLGLSGEVSPFGELAAEGRSTVDAVRAAREVVKPLTRSWVVIGHSQGGQSALGTAQVAATRAPTLPLLGTVAMAPVSHFGELLDMLGATAPPATFTLPEVAYVMLSAQVSDPRFDPASILSAGMAAGLEVAKTACYDELNDWYAQHPPATLFKGDWRDSEPLRLWVSRNDPGTRLLPGPLLLAQGEADTTVPPPLTAALDRQFCAIGQQVEYKTYPGIEHIPLVRAAEPDVMAWVADRFAGKPAGSTCPPA
jgi:pimeloyl-ACP methyl ester carboxylesterase